MDYEGVIYTPKSLEIELGNLLHLFSRMQVATYNKAILARMSQSVPFLIYLDPFLSRFLVPIVIKENRDCCYVRA